MKKHIFSFVRSLVVVTVAAVVTLVAVFWAAVWLLYMGIVDYAFMAFFEDHWIWIWLAATVVVVYLFELVCHKITVARAIKGIVAQRRHYIK